LQTYAFRRKLEVIRSFTEGCVYNNLSWVSVNSNTNLNLYFNNLSLWLMCAHTDPIVLNDINILHNQLG
jgi:hypothetical protein